MSNYETFPVENEPTSASPSEPFALHQPACRTDADKRETATSRIAGLALALTLFVVWNLTFFTTAHAQTQSETRFEYDAAGNIVRVVTETNDAPPTVSSLTPSFINRGSSVFAVALGNNLVLADVLSANPRLIPAEVVASRASVQFRLRALLDADLGPTTLTFQTRLGTASAEIFVAERVPIISTSPNPIILTAGGEPQLITLLFDEPFDTDQTYQVAIRDPSVATVQETSVTLPAGGRAVQVNMTGVNVGNTTFDISQPDNFLGLGIPVIVVADEPLPPGSYQVGATPVSVVINVDEPLSGTLSAESEAVRVIINVAQPLSGPLTAESEPVGVLINVDQPLSGSLNASTPVVGVAYGATGTAISPSSFTPGTSGTLRITGSGLDEVTSVVFYPSDGITQTGPLSAAGDGSFLDVPLAVDAAASPGIRAIVLTTAAGDIATPTGLEILP